MPPPEMHRHATTDELIEAYVADGEFRPEVLTAAIPASIDALYSARNADMVMHAAGAACAVAALRAADDVTDYQRTLDRLRAAEALVEACAEALVWTSRGQQLQGTADAMTAVAQARLRWEALL